MCVYTGCPIWSQMIQLSNISKTKLSRKKCFRQKLFGSKGDISWCHWFDLGPLKIIFNFLNGSLFLITYSYSSSRELSKTLLTKLLFVKYLLNYKAISGLIRPIKTRSRLIRPIKAWSGLIQSIKARSGLIQPIEARSRGSGQSGPCQNLVFMWKDYDLNKCSNICLLLSTHKWTRRSKLSTVDKSTFLGMLQQGKSYTLHHILSYCECFWVYNVFQVSHKKKSKLDKSGDLGYHDTGLPRPIRLSENVRSKWYLTLQASWLKEHTLSCVQIDIFKQCRQSLL